MCLVLFVETNTFCHRLHSLPTEWRLSGWCVPHTHMQMIVHCSSVRHSRTPTACQERKGSNRIWLFFFFFSTISPDNAADRKLHNHPENAINALLLSIRPWLVLSPALHYVFLPDWLTAFKQHWKKQIVCQNVAFSAAYTSLKISKVWKKLQILQLNHF